MSLADDLLNGNSHSIDDYLQQGGDINDIDEYGFTPLIEAAISSNLELAKIIVDDKSADVNTPDVAGRTALHWAIDNNDEDLCRYLLEKGADVNHFTHAGQSPLVYPILRQQKNLKELLMSYQADVGFALDYINTKLMGHRFSLTGYVDIVNHLDEFIELDYEGFYLEFSVAIIHHSLARYKNNYAARDMREHFTLLKMIIQSLQVAGHLLQFQRLNIEQMKFDRYVDYLLQTPLLILPMAYRGHAVCFIKYRNLLAKIDRGEHGRKHGTATIYWIQRQSAMDKEFLRKMMFERLSESFVHQDINQYLDLQPVINIPIPPQASGNCSWANIEASIPLAYILLSLYAQSSMDQHKLTTIIRHALTLYQNWQEWDQERALDECIQQFNQSRHRARKASKAAILAATLFQRCRYNNNRDIARANKIMNVLAREEYHYILKSYVEVYINSSHTFRGNHLLHILEDHGITFEDLVAHPKPMQPPLED